MEAQRITKVRRFDTGYLIVFDQHGQQMPDYQGHEDEIRHDLGDTITLREKIRRDGNAPIRDGELVPWEERAKR